MKNDKDSESVEKQVDATFYKTKRAKKILRKIFYGFIALSILGILISYIITICAFMETIW